MRLSDLLIGVPIGDAVVPNGCLAALMEADAAMVRDDSREVRPGDVFVALRGQKSDGHAHLGDAARRGALVALVEQRVEETSLPHLVVPSTSQALALLSANLHGRPAEGLLLCAVTGTNGKTTTTSLVDAMLRAAGRRTGLIGTVAYRYLDQVLAAPYTTPTAPILHETLARMRAAGVEAVTLEASSHALALGRLAGLRFRVAAFTNLTQDHLDFHRDMEEYFLAKARLFQEHLLPAGAGGTAVVCIDSEYGQRLANSLAGGPARLITVSAYGAQADVFVRERALLLSGTIVTFSSRAGEIGVRSPLIGEHNLENLAVACGCGLALGLPPEVIGPGLSSLRAVPGRLERVAVDGDGPHVFVDYAHTPDALYRAIRALRALIGPGPSRLIVVFGCGGDRDQKKRRIMGEVAARDADLVIITSDNPRTEEPAAIISMITAGIESGPAPMSSIEAAHLGSAPRGYLVESDRRRAIALGVQGARDSDVVLVAGKGHEDYQIIGTTKHPFDDRREAENALRLRKEPMQTEPPPHSPPAAPTPSIDLPIDRVLSATAGQLLRGGARKFTQVTIDGRTASQGALFIAIRGEHHDGHAFAAQAVQGGATCVMVERGRGAELMGLPSEVSIIEVGDTIVALGQLARAHRDAPEISRGLQVVGVTGSCGKTCTKDMLAAILSAHAPSEVLATEGNLNNHLGVPLTLLRLRPGVRFAVVEMGMSARGEIAYLSSLAQPTVAVIVNVGPAHLGSLGSIESIADAKGELFIGMADGGSAIYPVGEGHEQVLRQARLAGAESGRLAAWRVSGEGGPANVSARVLSEDADGITLRLSVAPPAIGDDQPDGQTEVVARVPLVGGHNAWNAALATAAALALGVPLETIVAGLAQVSRGKHRGQLRAISGRTFIDDCYNASPLSFTAALRSLVALRGQNRAVVVLGDMLELGAQEIALHEHAGEQVAEAGVALLLTVGARAAHAARIAGARGVETVITESPEEAARQLARLSAKGDHILIKGSRGMRLEQVLEHFPRLAEPEPPAPPSARSASGRSG